MSGWRRLLGNMYYTPHKYNIYMITLVLMASILLIIVDNTTANALTNQYDNYHTIENNQNPNNIFPSSIIDLLQVNAFANEDDSILFGQKVYSWTDKVHITIFAPDHNFNSNAIDTIGNTEYNSVKITTREGTLKNYKLVETGPNTGIFKGEVSLIGFDHNADGDTSTGSRSAGYDNPQRTTSGSGPRDGYIAAGRDDGITVAFDYSEDNTISNSAIIAWNIGEVEWLKPSHTVSDTGTVRVIDPDMNWNADVIDRFEINVRSESEPVGITLIVTESAESSGIFEGTVTFTSTGRSTGEQLRVAQGDVITASYEDNTLPRPYSTTDSQEIMSQTKVGTAIPPLERVKVSEPKITTGFGTDIGNTISAGQQVQITSLLTNEQDKGQKFVYIVMVNEQDTNTTISLSWIIGSLQAQQSLNAAASWLPKTAGEYTINVFVWESIPNPNALAPPLKITVVVN